MRIGTIRPIEFSVYEMDKTYESRNGKIIFDDNLKHKLYVCEKITHEKYGIKLFFEHEDTLNKIYDFNHIFKSEYRIHCYYNHREHNDLTVKDIVLDMFKYCGIKHSHPFNERYYMTASTYNTFTENRMNNSGYYYFEDITIPHMMYSDTNRVLEEKRKLMINPHHF
jgi:hypothetical protein